MITEIKYINRCVWGIFLMILAMGCTLGDISGSTNSTITEEDLQATSQILGESLSSDNSGIFLSIRDALTTISNSGFSSPTAKSANSWDQTQTDHNGIGNESNYQYAYDAETGIHTISFERQVQRTLFQKSVTDTLNYLYQDNNGNFIEFPRQQEEQIESIAYNGRREGQLSTLRKESFFTRKDTLLVNGVSNTSPTLNIDGVHNGKGTVTIEPSSGNTIERSYELEINFLNIEIQKSQSGEINVERGVSGTLSWEMTIDKTTGQGSDSKTIRGTIELSGDGTALLRFENLLKLFQVNINDGDVKDQDEEFEGRVTSVSTSQQSVTLFNGRTVYLTDNTEIDSDEYPTLRAVQNALNNGVPLWTEGEGSVTNGRFIVQEIEFETDDEGGDSDDDGEDEIEFEERLTAVDVASGTFTLANRVAVVVNEQTKIDQNGDYQSLEEVVQALDRGVLIEAEGEAIEADNTSGADLIAVEVEFDADDDDSDNDEDD